MRTRARWPSAWRSKTAAGPQIARHADLQRRCWRSWESMALKVSHASQTVIVLSSDEAEFHFCREQPRVRCRHNIPRQGGDGQCERLCEVTITAAIGMSSRSRVQAN